MVSIFVHHSQANYLGYVAMTGFWTSGILLFLYVINVVTYLTAVPWVKVVSWGFVVRVLIVLF